MEEINNVYIMLFDQASLTRIRNLSISKYLHEKYSITPNIGFDSELSILNGFWSCPFHRESEGNYKEYCCLNDIHSNLAPWFAEYSLSTITLARPKSATLVIKFSPMRTFLAARSRWIKPFLSKWAMPLATWWKNIFHTVNKNMLNHQTWAEIDIKLSNGNLPPPSTSFLKKSSKAPLHIYLI